MAKKIGEAFSKRQILLNWIVVYFSIEKVRDPKLWRTLRRELQPYDHPVLYRLMNSAGHPVRRIKKRMARLAQRIMPAGGSLTKNSLR